MWKSIREAFAKRELLGIFLFIAIIVALAWIAAEAFGANPVLLFAQNPYFWYSVLFGVGTGSAEVIARYRDEPFLAVLSPSGFLYLVLNGAISGAAYGLLSKYKDKIFPGLGDDLMRSFVAGFGAMIVMRSKLFNFKTESGEDYAIGPDAVLSTFLNSVDRNIDRNRSLRRQRIVFDQSSKIADPVSAPAFLSTSLASYQNLSAAEKKDLDDAIKGVVDNMSLDPRLKLIAISFGLLNICGEKNFSEIMESLRRYQTPPIGVKGAGVEANLNEPRT
jgi:hypothetical protein